MEEPFDYGAVSEGLQMTAWLTQAYPADAHVADLELAPNKMIQRHTPRHQIATGVARSKLDVIVTLQSLDPPLRSGLVRSRAPA